MPGEGGGRRSIALLILLTAPAACHAAASARAVVLDDFESAASTRNWSGGLRLSRQHSAHGVSAGEMDFSSRGAALTMTGFPEDWRGYDRLLFDIFCGRPAIATVTLRIYDGPGTESAGEKKRDYFEAEGKILVLQGWNHAEVNLHSLRTASNERDLLLGQIRRIVLQVDRGPFPLTLFFDNFRLAAGEEPLRTASRKQPADTWTAINGRFFTVRQVARPEDVPESAAVTALRQEAEREQDRLAKTIETAKLQGIETIYEERYLVTADLGLRVRPRLPWFNNDRSKAEMFSYVARSCREARRELEDKIQGLDRLPAADDTRVGGPLIAPFGPLKGRPSRGWFFVDEHGDPMIILSLHSPSVPLQRFFATPFQHIESYSVGGGSRWTIDQSPVYKAFLADPDTHRVGWDGWCGHLIRDLDSMGGTKLENTVICLESPRIRKAIEEYIRLNIPKFDANPNLLYDIMGYELMYICYCDRSQKMFREWLEKKHGTIADANLDWGTQYKQFADVVAPPVKHARPLPGTNRGLWYDWARFNQDRFTDHLLWVRSLIRKIDPNTPLAAGGSSSMLSGDTGVSGIDEERIVNEVDDVIIHEGGGSTMGMDLQRALSETPKPLADPEMSLGAVEYLLPQVLHGKSVAQIWHWPSQPPNEFYSTVETSLAHGWIYSLADIGELLRAALDVRRLNREIAAFVDAPAEVAILYSQTATLQLPPEMLTWQTTPYLAELRKAYQASQPLDARVTFVTERQIRKGWLEKYKLLIVPAVRNIPADVVDRIWDYSACGGRVLITPESLSGDEYNRPQPYLSRLGLQVLETRFPKITGSERLIQGYDQSFSREVSFSGESAVVLKQLPGSAPRLPESLTARGIRQTIRTAGQAATLFQYPDGSAAIVRYALGKGAVYYSAASLEKSAYSRLLDALFDEAGVSRPVRVAPLDATPRDQIEARFALAGGRKLLYVVNFGAQPAHLRIKAPAGFLRGWRELRQGATAKGNVITVAPGTTNIYELLDAHRGAAE